MDPPDLAALLAAADAAHGLFVDGETVLVGVSGGPDSVALLCALLDFAPRRRLSLHVAHVDHRLRPESVADADFVRDLAVGLGLPAHLESVALPTTEGGVEAAARAARYAALARVAGRVNARAVAVAHTADDQAETVLLNLIRGTGLAGLGGMRPVSSWPAGGIQPHPLRLLRPFLAVPRAHVLAYLAARGQPARDDASNRDLRFLRNRVRHEVLPAMAALNPRVHAALARLADTAAEDAALLDELADGAWPALVNLQPAGVTIDLARWAQTPAALQQRVLRRAACQLLGDGRAFGWEAVTAVRALIAAGPGGRRTLPGGLEALVTGGALCLGRPTPGGAPEPAVGEPAALTIPGSTALPGGWRIDAELRAPRPAGAEPAPGWACQLDAAVLGVALWVRGRRPGDRMAPLGMAGHHRRLQDILVDARVPRVERANWPVVVAGAEILWVAGVRRSEAWRVGSATRAVLVLTAVPPERLAGWRP